MARPDSSGMQAAGTWGPAGAECLVLLTSRLPQRTRVSVEKPRETVSLLWSVLFPATGLRWALLPSCSRAPMAALCPPATVQLPTMAFMPLRSGSPPAFPPRFLHLHLYRPQVPYFSHPTLCGLPQMPASLQAVCTCCSSAWNPTCSRLPTGKLLLTLQNPLPMVPSQ